MATASATQAQQIELQRQVNIVAKDIYQIITQPQDVVYRGPELDAKLVTLVTAIQAVQAAV